jgi:hypothetical protein
MKIEMVKSDHSVNGYAIELIHETDLERSILEYFWSVKAKLERLGGNRYQIFETK